MHSSQEIYENLLNILFKCCCAEAYSLYRRESKSNDRRLWICLSSRHWEWKKNIYYLTVEYYL